VLLNTTSPGAATPTFAAQQTFGGLATPQYVATGDVDGDGKPDLIVASYSGGMVSVLINTTPNSAAVPSFAALQMFATGTSCLSVTTADINGDGRLDLVVANLGGSNVSVLLNTTLSDIIFANGFQ